MHDFSFREAYDLIGVFAKAAQLIEKLLQSRRCIRQERNVISINEGGQMAGHASGCLDGNSDVWRLGSQPGLQGIDEDTKARWAERTTLADSRLGDGWLANTTPHLDCHRRFGVKGLQRRKHAITHTERKQPLPEYVGAGERCRKPQ